MEDRVLAAYALSAVMVLVFALAVRRYVIGRRQYKIRQMGRGKNNPDTLDSK